MSREDFVNKTFVTNSFEETQGLGCDFAKTLKKGDIVCLYGDLGSGKTTFTQGLAVGLGIKNRIISPTFVIVRSYELGVMGFYHIDLYRIESADDMESLGIEEIINNKQGIVVIEWAEKLGKYLPRERIDIQFSYEKDDSRKISFRSSNQ
jgi:tRNA threonylcarbamoyladenosine biosynthesis protein TsaE